MAEVKQAAAALEKLLSVFNLLPAPQATDEEEKGADAAVAKICKQFSVGHAAGLEENILALISERNSARKARDFAKSDAIRAELAKAGIVLEDRKDGSTNWRKS